MTQMRLRPVFVLIIIFALFMAACAPSATPTPTPVPVIEEPTTEPTEEATAEAQAATEEATEAATEEAAVTEEATEAATEEAAATTEVTTVAMATVEATVEPTEEAVVTEEATEEAAEPTAEVVAQATTEATEEAVATEEATEEAVATTEATEEAVATEEATEEATVEATEEATAAPTEEVAATEEPAPITEFAGAFTFSFPEGWELNARSNDNLATISQDDALINVYGPAQVTTIVSGQEFEDDVAKLSFVVDRLGLTAGDVVADAELGANELARISVELPRRDQAGTASLVNLDNDRQGIVVALQPAGQNTNDALEAAFAQTLETLVYPADIIDTASANDDFSTLVAAVQAAGLEETLRGGEFTVFAPTNEAFEAALASLDLTAEDLLANTDALTAILQYHVVEGTMLAADIAVGELPTIGGEVLTISMDGDTLKVNDASVTTADIVVGNGVIHAIDTVLLPSNAAELLAPEPTPEPTVEVEATAEATEAAEATAEATEAAASDETIVEIAVNNEDFSTLVAAVTAADLVEMLGGEGPYTVFAPTNEAFAATLEELGLTSEELLADTELLTAILQYHVIEGTPADLEAGDLETANGAAIVVAVDGEVITLNEDVTVVGTAIPASNGVIYVIDKVLVPPAD